MNLYRAKSVQYPRRRIFLSNLNELIERKVVVQPEIEISNKLFPNREFAKKLAISHRRIQSSVHKTNRHDLNLHNRKTKNMQVSSLKKLRPSLPTDLMVNPLHQSIQLKQKLLPFSNNPAKLFYSQSQFYQKNEGSSPNSNNLKSEESGFHRSNELPQRDYLKKGSHLQKQIVVNLLRNKLLRQREKEEKRQYKNDQIIKMIHIYKGVQVKQPQSQRKLTAQKPKQKKERYFKELNGWEHQYGHEQIQY